jgi:hypothetical protein
VTACSLRESSWRRVKPLRESGNIGNPLRIRTKQGRRCKNQSLQLL